MNEALIKRCEERIAKIRKDKDEGVYAKQYVQDVTELMNALESAEETLRSLRANADG